MLQNLANVRPASSLLCVDFLFRTIRGKLSAEVKIYSKSRFIRGIGVNSFSFIAGLVLVLLEPHNPPCTGAGLGLVIGATVNRTSLYYKDKMSRWFAANPQLPDAGEELATEMSLEGKRQRIGNINSLQRHGGGRLSAYPKPAETWNSPGPRPCSRARKRNLYLDACGSI